MYSGKGGFGSYTSQVSILGSDDLSYSFILRVLIHSYILVEFLNLCISVYWYTLEFLYQATE